MPTNFGQCYVKHVHKVWISRYKMSRQSVKSFLNHFVNVVKMSDLISIEAP